MQIELLKRYNKKEIVQLLEMSDAQLKRAEEKKLLIFFDGGMYGVYFFQFLQANSDKLEEIQRNP
jgi:hypothetical protein